VRHNTKNNITMLTLEETRWMVTRVDGKIASVSIGLSGLQRVLSRMQKMKVDCERVECNRSSTDELLALSPSVKWEDLALFGTPFQKEVWKRLYDITHGEDPSPKLMSYSSFAESMGKLSSVRSVAHAVALNPIAVILPCHLIIPKESAEKLAALIEENSLFKWQTLYMVDKYVDYGEYAYGPSLKRALIRKHMNI